MLLLHGFPYDIHAYAAVGPRLAEAGCIVGDPALDAWETALAKRPRILVPAIAMDGLDDGVAAAGGSRDHEPLFGDSFSRTLLPGIGHNLRQEAPGEFADAVLRLLAQTVHSP